KGSPESPRINWPSPAARTMQMRPDAEVENESYERSLHAWAVQTRRDIGVAGAHARLCRAHGAGAASWRAPAGHGRARPGAAAVPRRRAGLGRRADPLRAGGAGMSAVKKQVGFGRRERQIALGVAMRFVKNRDDAEDAAQDAMLLAYRHRASFRGDSEGTTW